MVLVELALVQREKRLAAITFAAAVSLHGGAREFAGVFQVPFSPASHPRPAFFGIGFCPERITAARVRASARFAAGARLAIGEHVEFRQRQTALAERTFFFD